jgi:acetyl esterase/lipase
MSDRSKTTWTYKRVGDLALDADVYRSGDERDVPIVVWIHGGGLIFGHRETIPDWLSHACTEGGFTLVSIDYRLAPETKLPEIVGDVEDALRWIAGDGPEEPPADPGPIGVAGESAGGYLALTAGFRVSPRLAAIVSLWGYGDLIGDWYSTPSPHHESVLSRAEALRQVAGPPVADERRRAGDGLAFYLFCRRHGLWPQEVAGWDPDREAAKFLPYMPVKNVTRDYPPTILVHGTKDTDVPYHLSVMMATEFERKNVEHRLVGVEGAEHGLFGAAEDELREVSSEAVRFLHDHLHSAMKEG